ncbi:hypothetical protein [Arcobacter vandammei]|uniref:hypothetical protein n=1 Tax=Arcobacter vandammei TaxID=2782243 RepID=UPI0018DFC96E|nr:hypothetical protein [Arcobacter vandammei]
MMKKVFILLIFFISSFANESLILQKQNVLNIQNIIEIEEAIARNYEKYLLNEFKIPTLANLKTKNYLGESFLHKNSFGDEIDFFTTNELKLKFAIKKAQYIAKDKATGEDNYIVQLYKRDLYRDFTTIYIDDNDRKNSTFTNSYVEFRLKSKEAQNIYNILKSGATIIKKSINQTCGNSENGKYCVEPKNLNVIKYMIGSDFIAYNLRDFEQGDVTVSNVESTFLDISKANNKLKNLRVGAYIFGKEKRHIRLNNEIKEVK